MSHSEIVETRGKYRAIIEIDEIVSKPDGDFFGTVVYVFDRGGCELMAHAYSHPAEDFGLGHLWEHYRDMGLVERYLRIWEGIVGFDYFETRDGKYVNVVTRKDLEIWGWDPDDPASWPKNDDGTTRRPEQNNLDEWRAYSEGDVWFVRVEKNVTWTTDDDEFQDHDDWTEIDDTVVHGYYGQEWAEQSARAVLDVYTKNHELRSHPDGKSLGVFPNSPKASAEARRLGLQAFTIDATDEPVTG
jgi:hypothetical protein